MDKSAIVVLHYQKETDTVDCLDSILTNHKDRSLFQIIAVVNSDDKKDFATNEISFADRLEKAYTGITVIKNSQNTGFAKGANLGIKKALDLGFKYVLLLNNDVIASADLLYKLVTFSKSDDSIGLVSPKIYFAKGFEYHKDRYNSEQKGKVIWYGGGVLDIRNVYAFHRGVDEVDKGQYDKAVETDFATGCCMLIPQKTVEKIGFFDEKYFLYFEDTDYSQRVKNSGMKVMYYPKAFLWHKNASSSGKPGSRLHIYYQNRNRLYFGFKYAPFLTRKSLFIDSLKIMLKGGVYTKSVIDYYLGRMGKSRI